LKYNPIEDLKLSVIMPVFNEIQTLELIVKQVLDTGMVEEIVMVDDGSTDGTRDLMKQWEKDPVVRVILHDENRGKGSAVRTGFESARGNVLIIQDADLEYDPRDYADVVRPIVEGRADVVYGSRFLGKPARKMNFWHRVGNFILTMLTNLLYNLDLSDMETCYKCFRADVVKGIPLRSRRFDFEPEVTAKVAKRGFRIVEVSISYYGRDFDEGKKITGWDALPAIWTLIKYRIVD
jgi:glycosyltransferase involved in cell wall biosynthesis